MADSIVGNLAWGSNEMKQEARSLWMMGTEDGRTAGGREGEDLPGNDRHKKAVAVDGR